MRVRNKLGDFPTMKLREDELARYAREADERARLADAGADRATVRPKAPTYPEIEVSVEVAEGGLEGLAASATDGLDVPSASDDEGRGQDRPSDVRLAVSGEQPVAEGPSLTSVPCVVASKEDLSWFELEETSNVILAMIDGESTVDAIVSTLTIPRVNALAILRELGAHGVIEFH
jgi:hypothetical protein